MIFKRITRPLYLFVLSIFLFIFLSCNNFSGGIVSSIDEVSFDITVSNYSSDQRSILPNSMVYSDIKAFKLEGISAYSNFSSEITVDSEGKATVSYVTPAIWSLTLSAYSDEECTKELLRGYAMADNRYCTAEVTFTLSSESVSTDGSFSLDLKVQDAVSCANVQSMTLGLYYIETGGVAYEFQQPGEIYNLYKDSEGNNVGGTNAVGIKYESSSPIKPGSYLFQAIFYSDDSYIVQCGIYSEVILIEPGRCTSSEIVIPNVINKKPAAPANFKAYLDKSSTRSGAYTVVFSWEDKSVNEQYFKIVVRKYSNENLLTGDAIAYKTYTGVNLRQSGDYAGGSLFSGSTSCAISFETGSLFDAEIYAVNSAGDSDVCQRVTVAPDAEELTYGTLYNQYGLLDGYEVSDSAPYSRINCVELSYSLNGGTMLTDSTTIYENPSFVQYEIYKGTNIYLYEIHDIVTDGSTQTYPIMYYGSVANPFTEWVNSSSVSQEYTKFENVSVRASFSNTSLNNYNIDDSLIFISCGDSVASSHPDTGRNCKNSYVEKASTPYVSVAVRGNGTSTFKSYQFVVNETVQESITADNTNGNYTIYNFVTSLIGTYKIQIIGSLADNTKYYSNVYTIEVR